MTTIAIIRSTANSSRTGLTTSMNAGSASRMRNAFGGQSLLQTIHGVPSG